MKKIDVHVHSSMWKNTPSAPGKYLITAEELLETYDSLGIEKGIIIPLVGTEAQFVSQSNEEAAYLTKTYPETYAWCCNIDPRMGKNSPDTDFTAKFIEEFGERIMFATDIVRPGQINKISPWLDEAHASGMISDRNYANICRENAIRLYGLK